MLPNWLKEPEEYAPQKDSNTFIKKTIKSIGMTLSRLRVQKGHEKSNAAPAILKLVFLIALILLISLTHKNIVLIAIAAVINAYLCIWPAADLPKILKPAFFASVLATVLFLPAMIMNPAGIPNNVRVIAKVFMTVEALNIFNHTTQWNHITGALRKLKLPGIFIFTLDITLKYIALLGGLIRDLLTSLELRSVGKNNKKYQSIGGVMGVTFIRSSEMSKEMYEAMQCRGFTGEY